jgi:hypothetical protein
MTSRQKSKGNAFERQVADHLSKIFNLNFERVPNSGAFTGGKNITRYNSLSDAQKLIYDGDILVPEELSNFKIECKSYRDFSFHGLFTQNKQLDIWIEQAESNFRLWFLIFKINNKGGFVVFDRSMWKSVRYSGNYVNYKGYYVIPMKGFFEDNYKTMLKMNEKYITPSNDQML